MKNISEIINKIDSNLEYDFYGNYIAKINPFVINKERKGKLVLVTAVSPTPYGEGKTTVSIGLLDGLSKIGKNAIGVLREPSLGPVFGIKGGATGGGKSSIIPINEINLNFTGDIHAITAANNLLSAAIDNHIHFGNELKIDVNNIVFKRCMDMNDRALKNITVGTKEVHNESFNITAASEVMAIFCLARNIDDLKLRLSNILIAYNIDGKPLYAKDLNVVGAMAVLLKDAIKPNLVQTLEGNPVIVHGGPFANIAHGCNSVIATDMGLKLGDYVITEAGFGSDLGALKFFDIKCRSNEIYPDVTVLVCTMKALKYNGLEENVTKLNLDALKDGINNLNAHIDILKSFTNNIIVCINKYDNDYEEELDFVINHCKSLDVTCVISDAYTKGGEGAIKLAESVIEIGNNKETSKLLYDVNESIMDKVDKIVIDLYGANKVEYTDKVLEIIKKIIDDKLDKLPICIAKNQYSLSDDKTLLGRPRDFAATVTNIEVSNGAGFIVVYLGGIIKMPGLPKLPNYINYDLDNFGNIVIK